MEIYIYLQKYLYDWSFLETKLDGNYLQMAFNSLKVGTQIYTTVSSKCYFFGVDKDDFFYI